MDTLKVNNHTWYIMQNVDELRKLEIRKNGSGYVYIVEFSNGYSKVGSTGNIKDRIISIKSLANNYMLTKIVKIAFTPAHDYYTKNETYLHGLFSSVRHKKSELFKITIDDIFKQEFCICLDKREEKDSKVVEKIYNKLFGRDEERESKKLNTMLIALDKVNLISYPSVMVKIQLENDYQISDPNITYIKYKDAAYLNFVAAKVDIFFSISELPNDVIKDELNYLADIGVVGSHEDDYKIEYFKLSDATKVIAYFIGKYNISWVYMNKFAKIVDQYI